MTKNCLKKLIRRALIVLFMKDEKKRNKEMILMWSSINCWNVQDVFNLNFLSLIFSILFCLEFYFNFIQSLSLIFQFRNFCYIRHSWNGKSYLSNILFVNNTKKMEIRIGCFMAFGLILSHHNWRQRSGNRHLCLFISCKYFKKEILIFQN